jgi:16S rRNA C967 or C1407 C5-methylase (RsmB/RsmF family)/NOL1/NOP2/fmu family ribosome biogenesis protein
MNSLPPIPGDFLERMQVLLGADFPAFETSLAQEPAGGLRTNTLKLTPETLAGLLPAGLSPAPLAPIAWAEEGFWLTGEARAFFSGRNPLHAAGAYYLQEPSAMAAAAVSGVQPGERILDLSAAQGGKSTHLAARLSQQGFLVANEIHPTRAWTLAENLERFGARNALITQETPERLADHFGAYFDRVLVDAPCSGEGMFRKSAAARSAWSAELVRGCALRQADILAQAARLVRPGGTLVYSTCTFAPEEDEGAVAAFLADQARLGRHFHLAATPAPAGVFSTGQAGWAGPQAPPELALALRLWPHEQGGDGHFIARLQLDDGPSARLLKLFNPHLPRPAAGLWRDFVEDGLARSLALEGRTLSVHGSYLYAAPAGAPDLSGLRVIHPGWWLGTLKTNRLEPAHALALGLAAGDARRLHLLSAPEARRYLAGESLPAPEDENGWTLAALPIPGGALPLGWAKQSGGQLKNNYPKGLRHPS